MRIPAREIPRAWSPLGDELLRELDAVDRLVREARVLSDVELVAVAVAGTQALVALTRLVERVEVHDEIELVVRAVGHPRVRVGVVGARLVEDRQRLPVARPVDRDAGRGEQRAGEQPLRQSPHNSPLYFFDFASTSASAHLYV